MALLSAERTGKERYAMTKRASASASRVHRLVKAGIPILGGGGLVGVIVSAVHSHSAEGVIGPTLAIVAAVVLPCLSMVLMGYLLDSSSHKM